MQIIKKKLRFIVNPISGVGKQRIVEDLLYRYLDHNLYDYEICYTKAPRHAIELSREAALFNYYAVIAVGGDGSVNEAAQGLINSNTALGILACGSGNGFARHLKLPLNLTHAIKKINSHNMDSSDVGCFNEHYFFNVSGVGFDGHVANVFSLNKKRGFKTYIKVVIKEVFSYHKLNARLNIDGSEFNAAKLLNSFCIGSQYGNNFYISPNSNNNDGLIELVMIDKLVWYKVPMLIYYAFTKQIHKSSLVKTKQAKNISIIGENMLCHLDGEPYVIKNGEIKISILPNALKVLV